MSSIVTIVESKKWILLYVDGIFCDSREQQEEVSPSRVCNELLGVAVKWISYHKGNTDIKKVYNCEIGGRRNEICALLEQYIEYMGSFPPKCPDVTLENFTFYTEPLFK